MTIDEENSEDMDNGFSRYQYTITFDQLQKTRNHKEHLAEIRFDANQLSFAKGIRGSRTAKKSCSKAERRHRKTVFKTR